MKHKTGDGQSELVNLGVFDDTSDISLTLWGAALSSVDAWRPSVTILLITNPVLRYNRYPSLSLGASTYIDIDPNIPDAGWVRRFAQTLTKREHVNPPWPEGGSHELHI